MNKNDTLFEWDATESAPQHYPMKIIQGTFIYHGEKEHGLYIPSGGTLSSGWGHPISSHVVGEKYKPLPDRLEIVFFSNAENQFYKGAFDLPYDKILALFRDGITHPWVFANGDTRPMYSRIMAGIAPGGAVAVWLTGQRTTEVFFGQAEKIDLDPSSAFALPFKSKEQADAYIAKQLVNVLRPEELESLKKNGIPFGLWARYRNRYDWLPTVAAGYTMSKPSINYLNGEGLRYFDVEDKKETEAPRSAPSDMLFSATVVNGKKAVFEIYFDEFETMAAFEKLGTNGKRVFLEFEPRLPVTDIRIRVYNDKESIELKKFVSKP